MILFLWAHPRSMSTAMERIMRERGDFHCLHEPFLYYFYRHLARRNFPHFTADPDRPTQFEDILKMLRTEEQSRNVFAKDMAYYVIPEILNHPGLAKEFNHVFLIRDPRKSIASYFRLDPDLLEEEVGLEAQWRLFRWISETTGREPQVLRAEDIQHDTQGVVGALWQNLGLSFVPSAFSWQAGSMPDDWVEVSNWHDSTASHSVIEKDRRDDAEIQAEFDAVAAEAPFLTRYLEHHWPYYLELSSRALVVDS